MRDGWVLLWSPALQKMGIKMGNLQNSLLFLAVSLSVVAFRGSWRGILLINSSRDVRASLGSVKLRNPARVPC